jgi:hypothetical protein
MREEESGPGRYLTREEILSTPDEPPGRPRVDWTSPAMAHLRRVLLGKAEISPPPREPCWAWAAMVIFSQHHELYGEKSRDLAVRWFLDQFAGLPGHEKKRAEVMRLANQIATATRRTRWDVILEAVDFSLVEAVRGVEGKDHHPGIGRFSAHRPSEEKARQIANTLLFLVRRHLKRDRDRLKQERDVRRNPPAKVDPDAISPGLGEPVREILEIERALAPLVTARQLELILALAQGDDLASAARRLGVASSTAREFAKQIRDSDRAPEIRRILSGA